MRWQWLLLSTTVCLCAGAVLLTLQRAEDRAREREVAARLFAARLDQTSATLAPIALRLARLDQPFLMRTVRAATAMHERTLDDFADVAPTEAREIRAHLQTLATIASGDAFSPSSAATATQAAARIANLADQVATEQHDRAVIAQRLSRLGSLLALGLAALLVGALVSRDRHRTLQREREETDHRLIAAERDRLTGLPNGQCLARDLERREASGTPAEVVLCDLDDFKRLNHQLGHEAGDAVLITVAGEIGSVLPKGAVLYRAGGDRFAVLGHAGAGLAEVVRAALHRGRERPLASVGAASWPADRPRLVETMRLADQRMYAAKCAGSEGGLHSNAA